MQTILLLIICKSYYNMCGAEVFSRQILSPRVILWHNREVPPSGDIATRRHRRDTDAITDLN